MKKSMVTTRMREDFVYMTPTSKKGHMGAVLIFILIIGIIAAFTQALP